MAEQSSYSMKREMGCGLIGGIFHGWQRKMAVHSLPPESSSNGVLKPPSADNSTKKPPVHDPKKRRTKSDTAVLGSTQLKADQKHTRRHSLVPPKQPPNSFQKNEGRRFSDAARSSTSSSSSGSGQKKVSQTKEYITRRNSTGESKELRIVVKAENQQNGEGKTLVRATSSNVMLLGHLGNLRQLGNGIGNNSPNATIKTVENLHRNLQDSKPGNGYRKLGGNGVMGNIMRQPSGEFRQTTDPEVLKNMGNEKYKQEKYEEALVFYDRAIALDSSKATYRSNRSAALIGLGRLIEAVAECKEAIRLDPSYQRAHYRLAKLYVRLGEAEKALYHYKHSGHNADLMDIGQAQALQNHLNGCVEVRKSKEWITLLKETERAISSGAESAPQVYAMQAEALLRLHRHQEAYAAYQKGPHFPVDSCTNFFGPAGASNLLVIEAQVYMAAGRFEDAVVAAQQAGRLDPRNKAAGAVAKSARAVSSARLSGNLLFKASKFSEACVVYSEGLEHNPHNSILLCNRAACRSKLGQYEKAVEDCTAALSVQPNYSKARLRRADCNAKMERWEAAIQDYEILKRESPADEEIGKALFDAQVQLKKQRGEDTKDMKFGSNLVFISSNERFRHFVTSPGMAVVLFCNKRNHKQVLQLMEKVCKRFPTVNFLKVEVEDHPYLAKSEEVTSVPSFKIYRNGSRVKDVPGNDRELLEKSVKMYSS